MEGLNLKPWAANIYDAFENMLQNNNFKGMKICSVKQINPLILQYENTDIGTSEGDVIYIHPLFNKENIGLDENVLLSLQNFTSSTAYNSPSFQAKLEGSIVDFISDFYEFYKNRNALYILAPNDYVAVWEMQDNTFLILQKVIKDTVEDDTQKGADK